MDLKNYISVTEDFPIEGISFKDVSPLLADKKAFTYTIEKLVYLAKKYDADYIIGPESRGFLFGVPVAKELGIGFIMARKEGKLPGELLEVSYGLEYGVDKLFIEKNLFVKGKRYIIIDDLMATGGTASALVKLVQENGGEACAVICVIELTDFNAKEKFAPVPFESLIQYNK